MMLRSMAADAITMITLLDDAMLRHAAAAMLAR